MDNLLEYLPPVQQAPASAPAQGADKYYGAVAQGYDAKRETHPKWVVEQAAIEAMLDDLPQGTVALDVPCGTGRFFDFYQRKGFLFCGIDKSVDMLRQAAQKVKPEYRDMVQLLQSNVLHTGIQDKCVDVSVMCRLTRWLTPQECVTAMQELQRVTRQRIIWTARVEGHKHARAVELFESALLPGWRITHNEAGYETAYRILQARPE